MGRGSALEGIWLQRWQAKTGGDGTGNRKVIANNLTFLDSSLHKTALSGLSFKILKVITWETN